MGSIRSSSVLTNVMDPQEFMRYCSIAISDIVDTLNGGVEFDSNIRSKTLPVNFTAADTTVTVPHGLARVPTGYIQAGSNAATSVYNTSDADAQNLYLKSSAISTVQVIVF